MSKKQFFYENTSPNIVIVPTVCCYGPPAKKPKVDKNIPDPPASGLAKIKTSKTVTDQKCQKTVTSSNQKSQQITKQPVQTANDNLLKASVEKDINKNSSAVEDLNKTASNKTGSWASSYLRSIDQLPKIPIKLNLSTRRKRKLSNEATTLGTCSKSNLNSNCAPREDTKKIKKITSNYEETSTSNYEHPFHKHDAHKNFANVENNSNKGTDNLSLSNTKEIAQYDKNKLKTLNTNTDYQIAHSSRPENKNIKSYKKPNGPKGSNDFPNCSSTILRETEYDAEHERVLCKSKIRSSDYLKPIDKHYSEFDNVKQKDGERSYCNSFAPDKTLKIIKTKDSKLQKNKPATQIAAQSKSDHLNLVKLPKLKYSDISDKNLNKNKSLKNSKDYKKDGRSKISARSDKNLCETKCSKPSIESRIYKQEDESKNNYKETKVKDNISSSKKSRKLEIKTKSKKKSELKKKTITKVQKSSKKFSSTSVLDAFAKDRSPPKESVKSIVQVTGNSDLENPENKRIDEKFDLRTKLSRNKLLRESNFFTKLRTRDYISKKKRDKIMVTIQNEKDDDEMVLKDGYKTTPAKDLKQSPEKPIYNKVNVIINVICNQSVPHDHESDKHKNDNCGSTSEDLSFLEDFNVDEIAELLKHGKNLTKQTNELGIGDICKNNVNRHSHETIVTIERFPIENEFKHEKATESSSQDKTLPHTAVVKEKILESENTAKIQEMTIQNIKIKTEASEESQHEITNDFDSAVDTRDQNNKVDEQPINVNNIIVKQEFDMNVEKKSEETLQESINDNTITAEVPLIMTIKKEPGIETNDIESDKTSKDLENERIHIGISDPLAIKSEMIESLTECSVSSENVNLSQKISKTYTNTAVKQEIDTCLPEADIVDLDSDDDDNRSDVTLVLSPTNEFKLSDLSDELIQNVGEIDTEIETAENNAGECKNFSTDIVNMAYIDSNVSNGFNNQNVSETDTETIEMIAEEIKNFSKDAIKNDSLVSNTPLFNFNEISIQNVSEMKTDIEIKETELISKLEMEKAKEDLQTDGDTEAENINNSVSGINVAKIDKTVNETAQPSCSTDGKNEFVEKLQDKMLSHLGEQYTVFSTHTGKFSELYHCSKNSSGEKYTVKVNKTSDKVLGFLKEKMLRNLQQDIPKVNYNCVYLLKGFYFAGSRCFLMDYYPKNLKQALEEINKPFHIDVVQNLARQLVTAVTVLRNKNIVHSDIKPSHILLNNSNRSLKLGGFDESYYIDDATLRPNIGTPSYRAPEVILGYSAGFSIDVWSTAAVFYEMVTGIQLFPGIYNNDILFKHMCTLGHMPFNMIQSSKYSNKHFCGPRFKRKCGFMGKNVVIFNQIEKSIRLQTTIYNSYRKYWGGTVNRNKVQDLNKRYLLYKLIEKMLVLDPNHRIAIEFVYADPFIFDFSFDNC